MSVGQSESDTYAPHGNNYYKIDRSPTGPVVNTLGLLITCRCDPPSDINNTNSFSDVTINLDLVYLYNTHAI